MTIDSSLIGTDRRSQLGEITLAVSYVLGSHAQCVSGTALLVRTAKHFGLDLIPRAIALAGQAEGFPPLASGDYATQFLKDQGAIPEHIEFDFGGEWEGSNFRTAGHMVAFDETSSTVLDPSLGQYKRAGLPNVVPVTQVDSTSSEWRIRLGESAFISYLPEGDTGGWSEQYEAAYEACAVMSQELVLHLASGKSPHSHQVRLDLDGAILR